MLIRPYLCHSSLAIRMLARKRLAGASRCAQTLFPLAFTTSSPEIAIGLTPLRVDPLANPVLSPLLQTVRGASPLPRLHRRGPIEALLGGGHERLGPISSTASSPWPH